MAATDGSVPDMRRFTQDLFRNSPDLSALTHLLVRKKYLAHTGRVSLEPEERRQLKEIVEDELLKIQMDDSDEEPLAALMHSKKLASLCHQPLPTSMAMKENKPFDLDCQNRQRNMGKTLQKKRRHPCSELENSDEEDSGTDQKKPSPRSAPGRGSGKAVKAEVVSGDSVCGRERCARNGEGRDSSVEIKKRKRRVGRKEADSGKEISEEEEDSVIKKPPKATESNFKHERASKRLPCQKQKGSGKRKSRSSSEEDKQSHEKKAKTAKRRSSSSEEDRRESPEKKGKAAKRSSGSSEEDEQSPEKKGKAAKRSSSSSSEEDRRESPEKKGKAAKRNSSIEEDRRERTEKKGKAAKRNSSSEEDRKESPEKKGEAAKRNSSSEEDRKESPEKKGEAAKRSSSSSEEDRRESSEKKEKAAKRSSSEEGGRECTEKKGEAAKRSSSSSEEDRRESPEKKGKAAKRSSSSSEEDRRESPEKKGEAAKRSSSSSSEEDGRKKTRSSSSEKDKGKSPSKKGEKSRSSSSEVDQEKKASSSSSEEDQKKSRKKKRKRVRNSSRSKEGDDDGSEGQKGCLEQGNSLEDSDSTSEEEEIQKNQSGKKAAKLSSANEKNSGKDEHPSIRRLKRCILACGVRRNYKKLFEGKRSVKAKVEVLKRELEELGVKGNPTLEKCKIVRLKREEAAELASLDTSNIISNEGRLRRRNIWNSYQTSLDTSTSENYKRSVDTDSDRDEDPPKKKRLIEWSNLKGIISDSGESD